VFRIGASDGHNFSYTSFILTVKENLPPSIASTIAPQSIRAFYKDTYIKYTTPKITDPEGDKIIK
jgi:hypothetical protein